MRQHVSSGSPYEERYGFARAVRVGDRVMVSGTAPIPQDGSEPPTTAFDQMLLCADIAVSALEELGGAVTDVVRTRMFVTDPDEADEVGRAHGEVFGAVRPAATMVVTRLLDERWKIEFELDAVIDA
ncbi:MAG: RidA family protein [Acidimicrobiia bacterium]|nr:RidA family protein [Acidimicrobiia bacterium]NNC74589.1 RidA family protein [Acidimicrobiia bacterium]